MTLLVVVAVIVVFNVPQLNALWVGGGGGHLVLYNCILLMLFMGR